MLMLTRTAKQQADLDALVDQMHNRNSDNFHQWLTPAQFGARFGPADSDVAAVKTWLESKGFTVLDVVPSKTHISFQGTVGQLRSAFGVNIHHVSINGEQHMATTNDPQIPDALAPVIGGLHKLDDFGPRPLAKNVGIFKRDAKTGKINKVKGSATGPVANFNSGSGYYELGPQDFYTVYNENQLLQAGITGAGQTIAVIEEAQVVPADVDTFRSFFGLPAYPSTPNTTNGGVNYLVGSDSGLGNYASCFAPVSLPQGSQSLEESEADIDLQWAGTAAPNAIIDFVACGGTQSNGDGFTLGSLGIDHSAQYIANYLYGSVSAASLSYGECEADMTSSSTTGVGYYNNQWEQFAAEGITPVVSSGDGGAEQCYQNQSISTALTLPPSVNGFGASAYNISAGGTDFGDLYESNGYTTTPVETWWNDNNITGFSSAVTYIPETTWAGLCSNILYASYLQSAGDTTYGSIYTPEAICSNSQANTDGLVSVAGGAGGISTFNTIPTWQNVYGVGLNSVSTTYRNLPDVSLFASNGFWSHFLPYCESDLGACTKGEYDAGFLGGGGTSFVAPQVAGLMALVNQKTGQRQGQANYTLYGLAAQEYGTPGNPGQRLNQCSGSAVVPGQRPPDSCIFYDVSNDMPSLQGGLITPGMYQPCLAGSVDCFAGNGGGSYGVNTVPGTDPAAGILGYTASPGYDDATGLGSLNINALVQGWNSANATFPTNTSLTASATTISSSGTVTLTATVVATGRGGTVAPAGLVAFFVGSTSGKYLDTGTITSTCTGTGASTSCQGTAQVYVNASSLSAGSNSIVAYFEGDGANDAPSTSPAQTVTVSGGAPFGNFEIAVDATTYSTTLPKSDSLLMSGWVADAVDGSPLSNVTVRIDGTAVGAPTLGLARPDVASAFSNQSYLNSGYKLTYPASSLSVGSHQVIVTAVDSQGASTTFGPLTFKVGATTPVLLGNLEAASDSVTNTSTVPVGDTLYVSGWVADSLDGAPLSNIEVTIDGTSVGKPTAGIARPDVASAFNNQAYLNSGYKLSYPASSLSLGSHQAVVTAVDSSGVSKSFGPLTFTVTAAAPTILGNLELVGDAKNYGPSVPLSDSLLVGGWAADSFDGAPLNNISISIDGIQVGKPTVGFARPDVASAFNNQAYLNSGYNFSYPVSSLSSGTHQVTVTLVDSSGVTKTFGPVTFTVGPVTPILAGNLEMAEDATSYGSSIQQTDSLLVGGWVADSIDGAPLSNVSVSIDGVSVGKPVTGIARPDVASAFNNGSYLDSGYNLTYPVSSLSQGAHQVTVTAIDSSGVSKSFGPLNFSVTAATSTVSARTGLPAPTSQMEQK